MDQLLNDLTKEQKKYPQDKQLTLLATQAQNLSQRLSGALYLSPTTLAKLPAGALFPKIIPSGGALYILNTSSSQLLTLSHAGKVQTSAINALGKEAPQQLLATDSGLAVMSPNTLATLSPQAQMGEQSHFQNAALAATGFRQNAYILDGQAGQILRFTRQSDTFAPPTPYLKGPLDSTGLVDLAVDGSVYVLRQTGSVEMYLGGTKQPFALQRASLAQKPLTLIATPDTSFIYVLTTKALFKWTKDGKFSAQYRLPKDASWSAVGIDETAKTFYIASNGEILKAPIPQ